MAIDEGKFYEFAIAIGEKELREIVDFAHKEYVTNSCPPRRDYKEWHATVYLRAIQQFLLKRGAKLQFKVEV